jgi:hypothetical protein
VNPPRFGEIADSLQKAAPEAYIYQNTFVRQGILDNEARTFEIVGKELAGCLSIQAAYAEEITGLARNRYQLHEAMRNTLSMVGIRG